jgi:hypothetical protein
LEGQRDAFECDRGAESQTHDTSEPDCTIMLPQPAALDCMDIEPRFNCTEPPAARSRTKPGRARPGTPTGGPTASGA